MLPYALIRVRRFKLLSGLIKKKDIRQTNIIIKLSVYYVEYDDLKNTFHFIDLQERLWRVFQIYYKPN